MTEFEKVKLEIENILVTIDLEKIEYLNEDGTKREV